MSTFPTDWQYKRSIAIDSGQKSGSPTGIVLTITHASGINDANGPLDADGTAPSQNGGGDIRCSSDAAGTVQIPVDVVSWVTDNAHASATCEIKVNFDDLTSDTLYLWWGTVATDSQPAATDTYGRNAVYSSGSHELVYSMDEDPSGSAPQFTDRTGNGNNGTSAGSMTSGDVVAGQLGSAIDFDGSDDYINTNGEPLATATAATISAWVNLDTLSVSHMLFGGLDNSSQPDDIGVQCYIRSSTGRLALILREDAYSPASATNDGSGVSTSTWSRVSWSWDGSNIRRYLSGTATGTVDSTTIPTIGTSGFNTYVGAQNSNGTPGLFLNGRIDSLTIYRRGITANDEVTLYNCESDNAAFWAVGSVTAAGGGGFKHYWAINRHRVIGGGII